MEKKITRPALESLACVEPDCELYGEAGQGNLTERKTYGKDRIRYLRCRRCGSEFSERKGTALWNTKVREDKAVSVAEHLSEGCSPESTARLAKVDISVVKRLSRKVGQHGKLLHDERVQDVAVQALEADERHGFSQSKDEPAWEAEMMDPESKLILSHQQGRRDEELIRRLYADTVTRLANPHDLVLFTDGEQSYASLFPEFFGVPYQPARQGNQGRMPNIRFRIPRRLAHVQILKRREAKRLVEVEIRYTHGSQKRAQQALDDLGYETPNTSAIERRNATARRMNIYQVRKSTAFSRRPDIKETLGWWGITVYNWCRKHRSLRTLLAHTQGKKSISNALPPGPLDWLIIFSQSVNCYSHRSTQIAAGDNLT
ncbi:MAG: hypothetical protein R3A44_25560 [Caldilineaceae bacterium]